MVLEYGTIQTGTSDGDTPRDGSRLGLAGRRAEFVGLFANVAVASGINMLVTSKPSEIDPNTLTASKLNVCKLSAREYQLNSRTDERKDQMINHPSLPYEYRLSRDHLKSQLSSSSM
jgi:hypothetical protein